jgi:predicted porin
VLDWAQMDYKVNEYIGFRAGDVKTPLGLLNETQDIDPAHLWVLLPQSIYPLASRASLLDHYGGVLYGTIPLGESLGKLEYRAFGGQRVIGADDGYFEAIRSTGITAPNGINGKTFGGTLRWNTPVVGLMVGASEESGAVSGEAVAGPLAGTLGAKQFRQTFYFGQYERNKLMLAAEYSRLQTLSLLQFNGLPPQYVPMDQRPFYVMASYKLASKLTGGAYYSSFIDRRAAFTSARYQKDWAIAARYDFNTYLYVKAEQHFIDGTGVGFSPSDNPNLKPSTRMTMFKLGVSF